MKVFGDDFAKDDVLAEALNQARVEHTGLNVPKIKAVTMIDGKWAIVSEYIKGKTLDRLMAENPDKKHEYMEMFVDLQIKVQSCICPLLPKLKDKMSRKISQADLDATTRYDLHTRLEGMPNTTNCATATSIRATSSSPMTVHRTFWIGRMQRRATLRRMLRVPICCSG